MMRREVKKLWDTQFPVVEAACAQLTDRLQHDPYLRERMQGVRVTATHKALYRCGGLPAGRGARAGVGVCCHGGAGAVCGWAARTAATSKALCR
jgi:hypothetical protein